MNTTAIGRHAESAAAAHLVSSGHIIVDRNWRTRYCEVDIITTKNQTVYFVEVKYRSNAKQGTGLDYITLKKMQQMAFAAQMWVSNHNWLGPYELAAIEVTAPDFTVMDWTVI